MFTVQETNLTVRNKVRFVDYNGFFRNRQTGKKMGGVATFVQYSWKQNSTRVAEGTGEEEFLVVRLDHVYPPINVINVYGGQESRMQKDEIYESWIKLKDEVEKIILRKESVVLIGDLNRAVGAETMKRFPMGVS